jgi:hypothetical protein
MKNQGGRLDLSQNILAVHPIAHSAAHEMRLGVFRGYPQPFNVYIALNTYSP